MPSSSRFNRRVLALAIATVGTGLTILLGGDTRAAAQAPTRSIAEAIAAAQPGDTVVIPAGTYNEQVVVNKPIALIGEGMPVIDGGHRGDVVVIAADGVTFKGFVVQNSDTEVSDEPTGIRLNGNNATIVENHLRDVLYGITLQESGGHHIAWNEITSIRDFHSERRGHAIYLYYSWDNVIEHNRIDYVKDGLYIGFGTRTRMEYNHVTHARYGIHYMYADDNSFTGNVFGNNIAGGLLMYSRNITFAHNEFYNHRSPASGYGLLFKDVDNVYMIDNLIHHNRVGITMEGAPLDPGSFVTLKHNLIGFNQVGIEMTSTTGATFTENTFMGNLSPVESRGDVASHKNKWSAEGRGNYWDEYQGYDANGDGVGDIEYRYEGAYDDLVEDNAALRAYAYTPARSALDLAAKWFPVYRPEPRVTDGNPLMSPTMSLPSASSSRETLAAGGLMLLMVVVPIAVFQMSTRTRSRKWQTC